MVDNTKGKQQSFTAWLRTRRNEDTRVGDLARDVQYDSSWPQDATTKTAFRRHLVKMRACDAALEAFGVAWTQYQRKQGGAQ